MLPSVWKSRSLAVALLAVVGASCGDDRLPLKEPVPATGSGGGPVGGAGGLGGSGAGGGPATPPAISTSCEDIGTEPTIPEACTTLLATKTVDENGKPTDEALDSAAIQAALDACPAGQAVRLAPDGDRVAFVSGPLYLKSAGTLWIDGGVTLFSSRDPADFDAAAPGLCGGNGTGNTTCRAVINANRVDGAAVVGRGTIDGRGGEPMAGRTETWWQLERTYSGNLSAPRLVQTDGGTNFTLYGVTMKNSGKFHVVLQGTDGFRVWGITINTPASAPNTDGVDPSATKNGIIAYSKITTGDNNVAVKGAGPVDGLVIAHNHFGRGHGMSIGSETSGGVKNVRVCDLSLDGTDNGLRIKSDATTGGKVTTVSYVDVCMRNVRRPLVFDTFYSRDPGQRIPEFRDVLVRNVHVLGGGTLTMRGRDAAHPLGLWMDNVVFDAAPTGTFLDTQLLMGPGPVGFDPSGMGVTTTSLPASGEPPAPCDCTDAWTTF